MIRLSLPSRTRLVPFRRLPCISSSSTSVASPRRPISSATAGRRPSWTPSATWTSTWTRPRNRGSAIRHVIETHLHADFVSGHRELAARTGAKIYFGAKAGARFEHVPVREGDEIRMGRVVLRFLETPGHTPESVSIVVTDRIGVPGSAGGPDRRHALHRRRRAPGPPRSPHERAGARRDALRLPAREAPRPARRDAGLSGPRRGVALRPQHLERDLLHHRRSAAFQLRPAADEPRGLRAARDGGSARGAGVLLAGRDNQSRGGRGAGRASRSRGAASRGGRSSPGGGRRRPRHEKRRGVRHRARAGLRADRAVRPVRLLGGVARAAGPADPARGRGSGSRPRGPDAPGARGARKRRRLPRRRYRGLGARRAGRSPRPSRSRWTSSTAV